MNQTKTMKNREYFTILTAGSTYLDIDAYACCAAMAELLRLQGKKAVAYSAAPCNYSVCKSLMSNELVTNYLPSDFDRESAQYIIVDVSDPDFIKDSVPLDRVAEVYDHHVGFEAYWENRIGDGAHIEFIGAAATLIYREWKKAGLQAEMSRSTALLLIAAILDNTLNLTSSNTMDEDVEVFGELCRKECIDQEWCASYFAEVQSNVENDLRNALLNDTKTIGHHAVLPPKIAQLCVWDASRFFARLPEIRSWFAPWTDGWMINIIDIKQHCSYFVCDDVHWQKTVERVFDVHFESGVAKSSTPYLRKEIIKKANSYQ